MKKIMFIKPNLETDAVWDPIRTCSNLGLWYLASSLKKEGHQVRYLDEVVRDNGFQKKKMFVRTIEGDKVTEMPLDTTYDEFQEQKMKDYRNMAAEDFVDKYTAFKGDNTISRTMVRTGNTIEETLEEIEKTKPEFVGIPIVASANHIPAMKLGKAIKQKFPNIKIMIGGQHVSALTDEIIKEAPWADYIAVGDAISDIKDIIEGKVKPGIVFGGFKKMEEFPILDPEIIEETNYPLDPNYTYPTNGRKSADFMFSKGCFRKCDFCVAGSQQGNHVTATEYEKLDKQLEVLKNSGVEELVVQDDAFLYKSRSHIPKILGMMKKYGMYWQNNGGIEFEMLDDEVTNQLIKYNKEGEGRVTALYVPFNPRPWNKNESAAGSMAHKYQRNLENLKRLREEAGIYIFTSEIIGTPEQTESTLDSDIDIHKKMINEGYIDAALTLSATMLPGTKWNQKNGHNIINKKDWAGYSLFTTHHKTENIQDPKTIEKYMVKRAKELDSHQKTYRWGTAFPNSDSGITNAA